jgi:hypothetical protein
LSYEWLPLRRGFVRKTMGAGLCDVFIGVPKNFERVLTTRPYYRSGYVFVIGPRARGIDSIDDPACMRCVWRAAGRQRHGATPPGHALAAHGNLDNVHGFTAFGVARSRSG